MNLNKYSKVLNGIYNSFTVAHRWECVYGYEQLNSTDRLTGPLGIAVRCIVVEISPSIIKNK